jgi:predicted double-glycine peptidase
MQPTMTREATLTDSDQPYFIVHQSPMHGKGGFAAIPIPAGTRIIEYAGQRITEEEVISKGCWNPDEPTHTFYFELENGLLIDGNDGGNDSRWINHSCMPNCEAREENERVFLYALRDIAKGEELAYDYRLNLTVEKEQTLSLKKAFSCRCGTPNCSGTMLGKGLPVSDTRFQTEEDQDMVVLVVHEDTGSAAALATILNFEHGISVSERDIADYFDRHLERASNEPSVGVSLLKLKRFAESVGLVGCGYTQLNLASLIQLAPAIVQINLSPFSHFSVFRCLDHSLVYLADPFHGNITLPKEVFLEIWQGGSAFNVCRPPTL